MIYATLFIRDEEDIIAENIEFHLANGVDRFIVTDNASVDRTPEIVQNYPQVVKFINEPDLSYPQARCCTHMARLAYDMGAAWVVHMDADEFWHGLPYLHSVTPEVVQVSIQYAFHHRPSGRFRTTRDMPYCQKEMADLPHQQRPIHRAVPGASVSMGHNLIGGLDGEKVSTDHITIHHYPNRSYEQFVRKITNAGTTMEKYEGPEEHGWHWRRWYRNKTNLRAEWDRLIPSEEEKKSLFKFGPVRPKLVRRKS